MVDGIDFWLREVTTDVLDGVIWLPSSMLVLDAMHHTLYYTLSWIHRKNWKWRDKLSSEKNIQENISLKGKEGTRRAQDRPGIHKNDRLHRVSYFSHLFAMNDENLDVHMRTLFSCFTLFILATIHWSILTSYPSARAEVAYLSVEPYRHIRLFNEEIIHQPNN